MWKDSKRNDILDESKQPQKKMTRNSNKTPSSKRRIGFDILSRCFSVSEYFTVYKSLNVHIMHTEMFILQQQSRRTQHAHGTGLKVYFEGKHHQWD